MDTALTIVSYCNIIIVASNILLLLKVEVEVVLFCV